MVASNANNDRLAINFSRLLIKMKGGVARNNSK